MIDDAPLPWTHSYNENSTWGAIRDAQGTFITGSYANRDDKTSAHIVHCVNNFDQLVKALEAMYAKDSHSDLSDQDLHEEMAAGSERASATLMARVALSLARGQK
jgi:hypothetical protein